MKNLKVIYKNLFLTILSAALFTFSCSKDDSFNGNGHLTVAVSSNTIIDGARTSSGITNSKFAANGNATIVISDFLMSIKEFELELDNGEFDDDNDLWDDDGYYDFEDEIELAGPFELDLMSNSFPVLSTEVPNGIFEELEFKFDKNTNPNSPLFNKSVIIKGTIDDVPFEFWHDFDDEVEVDFDNPEHDLTIHNNGTELTINFDLSSVLNSVNGVDLSLAVDGNNNGTIEINPNDLDGNTNIADQIKEQIKSYIDLLDD